MLGFLSGIIQSLMVSGLLEVKKEKSFKRKIEEADFRVRELLNEIEDDAHRTNMSSYLMRYYKDCFQKKRVVTPDMADSIAKEFEEIYAMSLSYEERSVITDCIGLVDSEICELLSDKELAVYGFIKQEMGKLHAENSRILTELKDISVQQDAVRLDEPSASVIDRRLIKDQRNDYEKKWNDVLFLHRGEPEAVRVRLRDLYILPDYEYKNDKIAYTNSLESQVTQFVDEPSGDRVLIILGQQGIGKSSFVSYLAAKYDRFLYLSFSKLNISGGILSGVIDKLGCNAESLKDRVIVIDGYDENGESHSEKRVESLIEEAWSYENLKVILTSRTNYIKVGNNFNNIIVLKEFDSKRVNCFVNMYREKTHSKFTEQKFDVSKIDVLGIPLLLYMICSLQIDLSHINGLNELYGKIFTTSGGGIYEKCRVDGMGYGGERNHPQVSLKKEEVHKIAQKIAFAIFEKEKLEGGGDNELCIEKADYENIVGESFLPVFAIANYYDINASGLKFVHKSIYEYFVAIYFYNEIKSIEGENYYKNAEKLAFLFKADIISEEIMNYLSSMICGDETLNTVYFYRIIKSAADEMFRYGMTYTFQDRTFNVLKYERTIFTNLLWLLQILRPQNSIMHFTNIEAQIKNYDYAGKMYLQHIDLRGARLTGVNLRNADIRGSLLTDANLSMANLISTDFSGASMERANLSLSDFRGACLRRVNMEGAVLSWTDLSHADLEYSNLSEANLGGANFDQANFRNTDLRQAYLSCGDLSGNLLSGANLKGANLRRVILRNADLRNADLSGADLTGADLTGANLEGAILCETSLLRANLTGVCLKKSYLYRTGLQQTVLAGVVLEKARIKNVDLDILKKYGVDLTTCELV